MLKGRFFIKLLFVILSIFFVENIVAQPYNRPVTGWSPYIKGIYSGNAQLTIKNHLDLDAVVRLYNISRHKIIRYAYVQSNTEWIIKKIPRGCYKIKFIYGKDWDPTFENYPDKPKGNFKYERGVQKFNKQPYFKDDNKGYSTPTLTLHSILGRNISTSYISLKEFFEDNE